LDKNKEEKILNKLGLRMYGYYLTIGRIVPENNIHLVVEAFKELNSKNKLVIVGPLTYSDRYTQYLYKLSNNSKNIIFTGGIYNPYVISTLRKYCCTYIHIYTVGGLILLY
jgi:glycosyltransferase involved in cell wall biosynthesis